MFRLEKDLEEAFIKSFLKRTSSYEIKRQVMRQRTVADIVLVGKGKEIAIEAKLNKFRELLYQAVINTTKYDESWVLIPLNKAKSFKIHLPYCKKKKIKVIAQGLNSYKILKGE